MLRHHVPDTYVFKSAHKSELRHNLPATILLRDLKEKTVTHEKNAY